MNKLPLPFLVLMLLAYSTVFCQKKLKKQDRIIITNIENHKRFIVNGDKAANDYIIKIFTKSGLKPRGDKEWYQGFKINDGKEIKPGSKLILNDQELKLYDDFFPFAFSASKNTEAAVAIALAENGVPWFKDIKELISDDDTAKVDTFQVIHKKATLAATKGASALIIYNKSSAADLLYNRFDSSASIDIPVLYITSKAFKKYSSDESAIIDVKINVELEPKSHTANNVIGYADNGADSIIITSAQLNQPEAVAALLECARLVKANRLKKRNYLFIVYSADNNGTNAEDYFNQHPPVYLQQVTKTIDLDSASAENRKGINLVKQSVEMIKK
ncbi:MAG TPA: M28 family metallopeptidase [Flavitalea sp.]|nr:M28 family metallopeptidase [Flavitalea sp.]